MDKKLIKDIIIYALIFLLICYLNIILFLIFSPLGSYYEHKGIIEYFGYASALIMSLIFFRPILLIFISTLIIVKYKNSYIYKLFDNIKISSIIFILLFILDALIYYLLDSKMNQYYDIYLNSLAKNFIPVYIVSLINTIRLKIISKSNAD